MNKRRVSTKVQISKLKFQNWLWPVVVMGMVVILFNFQFPIFNFHLTKAALLRQLPLSARLTDADGLDGSHASAVGGASVIPLTDVSGNLNLGGGTVATTGNLQAASGIFTGNVTVAGNASHHWAALYVDDLIVGGAGLSSTTSQYYSVNSDALTDETGGWRIYRGPPLTATDRQTKRSVSTGRVIM